MWEHRQNSDRWIVKVDNGQTVERKGCWLCWWERKCMYSWVHTKCFALSKPKICGGQPWTDLIPIDALLSQLGCLKLNPTARNSCVLIQVLLEWKRLQNLVSVYRVLTSTYWVSTIRSTFEHASLYKSARSKLGERCNTYMYPHVEHANWPQSECSKVNLMATSQSVLARTPSKQNKKGSLGSNILWSPSWKPCWFLIRPHKYKWTQCYEV